MSAAPVSPIGPPRTGSLAFTSECADCPFSATPEARPRPRLVRRPVEVHIVVGECYHSRIIAHGGTSFSPLQAGFVAAEMNREGVISPCGEGCLLRYRVISLAERPREAGR